MTQTVKEELAAHKHINASGLTVLFGILTAFAPFSIDMYLAGFPAIAKDMNVGVGDVQLTLSVFFLGLAIGQLFYGPLTDRFGRRIPLLVGLVIYAVSSFSIIYVKDINVFIFLRFLQAVGGCAGIIISRAIIQDIYDLNSAARAFSLMMAVQAIGPIAAPVLGGYILGFAGWETIFVFLCGLGICCFTVTFLILPETLPAENRLHQPLSGIMSVFSNLLRNKDFMIPCLAGGIGGSALFVFISGSPFVFITLYGLSEKQYGWAFGLIALGMGSASQINRLMLSRFSPYQLMVTAVHMLTICCLCLVLFLLLGSTPSFFLIFIILFFALGTCPIIIANSTAIAMATSRKNAGSASSLVGVSQFSMAGIVSALIGFFHDNTAMPMSGMMLICGLSAMAILVLNKFLQSHHT